VTIRVSEAARAASTSTASAVPLMVHEAVVNALKHASPSSVAVTVDAVGSQLHIVVSDDGRGFGFRGRYEHAALSASRTAPRSLFERVEALGGELAIESRDSGSRVEISLTA
jgi:signal transduction histidine kinase